MTRPVLLALATLVAAVANGCARDVTGGYVMGGAYRDDVRTIAIPIFENGTYTRNVEDDLTDAVIKEIQARTPWQVVSGDRADTVLLGRITRVEHDEISKSRLTGLGEEVILSVTIDFEWRDLRSDRPILERRGFAGHALFVPSTPSGEPIDIGEYAVVQQLARDIVAEMRSDW